VEQAQQREIQHAERQLAALRRQEERMLEIQQQHVQEMRTLYQTGVYRYFDGSTDELIPEELLPPDLANDDMDDMDDGDGKSDHDSDSLEGSFSHLTTAFLPPPPKDPLTGEIPDREVSKPF
jgi:hypothetical protein